MAATSLPFLVAALAGATTPIEMMYLSAASTLIVKGLMLVRGTIRKKPEVGLGRPFLHATELGFEHPVTGELLRFDAPLPPDLARFLAGCQRVESEAT